MLVPLTAFQASAPVLAFRERRTSLEDAIEEAVRLFSVSREVILRRFLTARTITRDTYRQTADAWKRVRRIPATTKKKGRKIPHHTARAELGARFISRVFAAHERGLLTEANVAEICRSADEASSEAASASAR